MNKENIMKNLDYFLIPENSLYQWLEKKHLDPSLSDEEWEEFVDTCQDSFATACRDVGKDFLETWWEYGQPIPPPLKERNGD